MGNSLGMTMTPLVAQGKQVASAIGLTVLIAVAHGRSAPGNGTETSSAKLFGAGHISTGHEYGATFSPDGRYLYFTRNREIYWTRRDGDDWSLPKLARFSNGEWIAEYLGEGVAVEYFNWDPVISPDGARLFIMSHGLVNGRIRAGEDGDLDLWVMEREGEGFDGDAWSAPRHLGPAINSPDHSEGSISVDADGTVYFFSSGRPDSIGKADIYTSRLVGGEYGPVRNVGAPINTPLWDGHAFVDPSGAFLLFISINRPGGFGDCDIYVSPRTPAGWAAPVNLGPGVNTDKCEITPSLDPGGETLYFGRIENREADVRNIYSIAVCETELASVIGARPEHASCGDRS